VRVSDSSVNNGSEVESARLNLGVDGSDDMRAIIFSNDLCLLQEVVLKFAGYDTNV